MSDTVKEVKAKHRIIYGAAQMAEPGSIFTPVSQAERDELIREGAAVELDDVEELVMAATAPAGEGSEGAATPAAAGEGAQSTDHLLG